ncbi:MAG: methyltransferase [Paracoccaceae bacterium]
MPFLRRIARAEGAVLFDLVQGFVQSQVLMALVELRVLHLVSDKPLTASDLGPRCGVPVERMRVLLQAGAAMGLLRRTKHGFVLAMRGAAMLGVPGLEGMVRHHRALYADLADPVAFVRGGGETQLAAFWPYVFGAAGAVDPEVTATYSGLMADSQTLVAEDTLRLVDLSGVQRLLDVGGGTGAFLAVVGVAYPAVKLELFDLPVVVGGAKDRLAPFQDRCTIHPGSFRDDPLPQGADTISLIRVLYDHADATVERLLAAAFNALPPGGRLIVSEPMSGGERPDPATDVYFAVYTMAMRTGRTRSADEISTLLSRAGFTSIENKPGFRPFVTSVVTARRAN